MCQATKAIWHVKRLKVKSEKRMMEMEEWKMGEV